MDIEVPVLGESVTEATVARWFKKPGEAVTADEPLVELETDKVSLEVPSPVSGVLEEIIADEGAEVEVGGLLARLAAGAVAASAASTSVEASETAQAPAVEAEAPSAASADHGVGPAVRKMADETGIDPSSVAGTGPKGNVTKGDMAKAAQAPASSAPAAQASAQAAPVMRSGGEERVKMTRLRRRIAERLKEAQNNAAMLTTFNEVDMSGIMAMRKRFQDDFIKSHGIKLGFMSFFVKAAVEALRAFPAVNAEIDGDEIVYKRFYDIGVAVGTDQGLVVPVVRGADQLTLGAIERTIGELGVKARDGKLSIEEMTGGTFTISNGGVYGSMLSTPILNPPQSGILGMHNIQQRPVVVDGEIVIRPMMYLALSYDHRIIDGKEAVSFLVRMKNDLENPERILLDL